MILLFILHFVADFVLQPRKMGRMKSTHIGWLLAHVFIQFIVFFPFTGLKFAACNALIHGVIDGSVWNIYKAVCLMRFPGLRDQKIGALYKFWEDDLFYKTIGFDQMLHGLTLIYLSGIFL